MKPYHMDVQIQFKNYILWKLSKSCQPLLRHDVNVFTAHQFSKGGCPSSHAPLPPYRGVIWDLAAGAFLNASTVRVRMQSVLT